NADADSMAEFERRAAGRPPAKTPPPQARPEVLSIEPRASLAVPAALTPQTAPAPRQTVAATEIAQAAPVQVAQSPLVPLRRPGDTSSSGGTAPATAAPVQMYGAPAGIGPLAVPPGGPSASPGDADPLGREINRELIALKRQTSPVIEAGIGFRG